MFHFLGPNILSDNSAICSDRATVDPPLRTSSWFRKTKFRMIVSWFLYDIVAGWLRPKIIAESISIPNPTLRKLGPQLQSSRDAQARAVAEQSPSRHRAALLPHRDRGFRDRGFRDRGFRDIGDLGSERL